MGVSDPDINGVNFSALEMAEKKWLTGVTEVIYIYISLLIGVGEILFHLGRSYVNGYYSHGRLHAFFRFPNDQEFFQR